MGGYLSGRHGCRMVVESCLTLNVYELQKGQYRNTLTGKIFWRRLSTGEELAAIEFSRDGRPDQITISYNAVVNGTTIPIQEGLGITKTRTNFAGSRYWWLCPGCQRRCGVLYIPPGTYRFRCRKCYNLTYRSSNLSRNDASTFRRLMAQYPNELL